MFDSLSRGYGFLRQSIQMAAKDRDLIKPSIYSFFVGIAISVIFAIPIILAAILLGGSDFGNIVVGLLGIILLFFQYAASYLFAGMTVYMIYGYLAEGDGRMDKAWAVVRRDFLDLLSLAAASALVKTLENFLRGKGRRGGAGLVGGLLASVLNAVWTTATYFVLPAMVIEDLSLGKALKRATYIIKENLLLVAVSEVGVSGIVGLIGFLLVFGAILVGVGIVVAVTSVVSGAIGIILAGVIAVPIAGAAIAFVTVASSYINTAYHTCLFLWAREAEKAQLRGESIQGVAAPAPLAAALAR